MGGVETNRAKVSVGNLQEEGLTGQEPELVEEEERARLSTIGRLSFRPFSSPAQNS